MTQKQKAGSIVAVIPFLIATIGFHVSAHAEGNNDPSVMTREADGSVTKKVFMEHHEWMFDQNDANKDGRLDVDEMKNLHKMVRAMQERTERKH